MDEKIKKTCNQCNVEKPIEDFPKHPEGAFGRSSFCKTCGKIKRAQKRTEMTESELSDYRKKRREDYHKNKDKRQKKHLEWLSVPQNAAKALDKARQYKKENRTSINAQKRDRYSSDPCKKIEGLCRSRVRYVLKGIAKKSAPTLDLIGCSFEEFRNHIERQFLPGMTWENLGRQPGTWQLDHIEPCCSFDLLNPEDQKKAFHYTNVQPLWYEDHKRKLAGDRKKCRKRK